jgi:hypothetical protein
MEKDCDDHSLQQGSSSPSVDLSQFLHTLSNQITTLDRSIQCQLKDNETRISQENEIFRSSIKTEMDELRQLVYAQRNLPSGINSSASQLLRLTIHPRLYL